MQAFFVGPVSHTLASRPKLWCHSAQKTCRDRLCSSVRTLKFAQQSRKVALWVTRQLSHKAPTQQLRKFCRAERRIKHQKKIPVTTQF